MKIQFPFAFIIVALSITSVSSLTYAKPGSNAVAEANFIKAVSTNATLPQIKKLLPKSTKFGAPVWEAGGNTISFRGKISGKMQFINARQKAFQSNLGNWDKPEKHLVSIRKFNPTDPINEISIVMDGDRNASISEAKSRIAGVIKSLGKPQSYAYYGAVDSDFVFNTWSAEWQFQNRSSIECFNELIVYKGTKKTTVLRLKPATYYYPFG